MYLQLLDSAVVNIDPSTLSFSGHTEDYPYKDVKRHACISFRLIDTDKTDEVVEYLKEQYLKKSKDVEGKITVRKDFESYESDNRPCITVQLMSGVRGLINPSSFSFCSDEHAKWLLSL